MIPRVPPQARECARPGCSRRFNPHLRETATPPRYCSVECWHADKPLRPAKPRAQMPRTTGVKKRRPISAASTGQRLAVQGRACIVCARAEGSCDPAHVISRAALSEGQDDPKAVVPMCRPCHEKYDRGELSILEFLEPHRREILAYAVERYGLLRTLQRVTNSHWAPVEDEREAA